jgi:hypothetical protein
MAVYFWATNYRNRASFLPKGELWREILHGLRPFPDAVFDEFQPLFEEETGSDVPVAGILPLADFVQVNGYCRLLSLRAREVLGSELEKSGEFYSVQLRGTDFWLYRPTLIVNCLDVDATRANRSHGQIVTIYNPSFIADRLPSEMVFMVPNCASHVFVRDSFKDLVKRGKLKGLYLYLDRDDRGWKT